MVNEILQDSHKRCKKCVIVYRQNKLLAAKQFPLEAFLLGTQANLSTFPDREYLKEQIDEIVKILIQRLGVHRNAA